VLIWVSTWSSYENKDGNAAKTSAWIAFFVGVAGFGAGVVGNLLANALQKRLDSMARPALGALANHDAANLVGESVRILLLLLLESKPPPPGMPPDDFPYAVSDGAKRALTLMAGSAVGFWHDLVVKGPPDRLEPYSQLHEPALSRFIIDPKARAMSDDAWRRFLIDLLDYASNKAGGSPPPFDDERDQKTTVAMLGEQFGRSFREALKWDSTHDGLGWAAIQLQLAGQLLQRLDSVARSCEQIRGALASLTDRYERGFKKLSAMINVMDARAGARHREMLGVLDRQYTGIMRGIGAILKELNRQVAPRLQPLPTPSTPATPPTPARDDPARFVFRTERLGVVGRDGEMKILSDWAIEDARRFSWDLWTGPAGAGKSRLALHLCRRLDETGWKAGFYDWASDHHVRFDLWRPEADTLIVFDYVAEHAERIFNALRHLADSAADWPEGLKVRCLLLERGPPPRPSREAGATPEPGRGRRADGPDAKSDPARLQPAWLTRLRDQRAEGGEPYRRSHRRGDLNEVATTLGGVSDEAAKTIIAEEAKLAGETPVADAISARLVHARRVDRHLRPLFVAMTAEAVRESGHVADFTALVEYIRTKEWNNALARLRAYPGGPGCEEERWAKLVCVATMTRGLRDEKLTDALNSSRKLSLPTFDYWGNGERYDRLVSGASASRAPELEPDVVGEAMVLWWLSTHPLEARALIDRAWSLGMGEFVARATQNFPDTVEASALLTPSPAADAGALAAARLALFERLARSDRVAEVTAKGRALLTDAKQPALVRALAAFAWMQPTPTPRDAADVDELLRSVRDDFSPRDLDDPAVREWLAKALFNAFHDASRPAEQGGDAARAGTLLDELRSLAKRQDSGPAVREEFAKALTNAVADAGADFARAAHLLNELRSLADREGSGPAVRETLARALFNAFVAASRPAEQGGDAARAGTLLDELRSLADREGSGPAVRETLAWALFNAFHAANRPAEQGGDAARAGTLLDELRSLADREGSGPAVREEFAKALFNAFVAASRPAEQGGDAARAGTLLDELRSLADREGSGPAVREWLARALFNAFVAASRPAEQGGDAARAGTLLDELRSLAGREGSGPAVREEFAKALNNAVAYAGADFARADHLLKELRSLADRQDSGPAVREEFAKALFNAFVAASRPAEQGGDAARAGTLLDELRSLAKRQDSGPAVRETLAWALFNAFHAANRPAEQGGDAARAGTLLDELRSLADREDSGPAVREEFAKALFNAFVAASRPAEQGGDAARAGTLLDELQLLADAHPSEGASQLPAYLACVGKFIRAGEREELDLDALEAAVALAPRLPVNEENAELLLDLVSLIGNIVGHVKGQDRARLQTAGAALRAHHQARFKPPPPPPPPPPPT
jgi:hypothetical protein